MKRYKAKTVNAGTPSGSTLRAIQIEKLPFLDANRRELVRIATRVRSIKQKSLLVAPSAASFTDLKHPKTREANKRSDSCYSKQ